VSSEIIESIAGTVQGIAETEVVKTFYTDAIQPTARAGGSLLGFVPRALNALLLKPHKWVMDKEYQLKCYEAEQEYNLQCVREQLYPKVANIPPEHLVAPAPYVFVPALQRISHCMDSEELRDMYAELLAKSMDERVKDNVHPSYVEIIAQLSPDEARALKAFYNKHPFEYAWMPFIGRFHIAAYYASNKCLSYSGLMFGILYTEKIFYPNVGEHKAEFEGLTYLSQSMLDNLQRLGFLTSKNESEEDIKSLFNRKYNKQQVIISSSSSEELFYKIEDFFPPTPTHKWYVLTKFGYDFCKTCVATPEE